MSSCPSNFPSCHAINSCNAQICMEVVLLHSLPYPGRLLFDVVYIVVIVVVVVVVVVLCVCVIYAALRYAHKKK